MRLRRLSVRQLADLREFLFAPKNPYDLVAERSEANQNRLIFPFWCVFTVWLELILSKISENRQEAALRAAQTILCARAGKKKGGWGG